MKILRLMGYPIRNFASLERFILLQGRELIRQGHEFELAFDGVANPAALQAAREFAPDVPIRVDFPIMMDKGFSLKARARYARHLRKEVKRDHFDIVHCYFWPSCSVVNRAALKLRGVKCLRTVGTVPRASGKNRLLLWTKAQRIRLMLKNMNKVICVSESVRARLLECKVPAEKMIVVHNTTDTQFYFPATHPPAHGFFGLTFTGRLVAVKEVEVLIQGTAELVRRGMHDVRLNIVGDGDAMPAMQSLVESLNASQHVKFYGRVSDVVRILKEDTNAYVTASRVEGLPCSVLEAMSCGLPVVASDIGEHREAVTDIENGFLFRLHDPSSFADAIERVRRADMRQIGLVNREKIVARFGLESWIAKEIAIYRSVAG